ncbi:hypothetical protein GGX14DRAFT_652573 [Mycena pura]|uniref:Uncharacterized protein n=1 Tax=Mycena pura TaxID=153505 RepID=A0AAD6YAX7_9AGAR|nr:hypothetical protein GGX14DRAFT_652573 [Mycena pura]
MPLLRGPRASSGLLAEYAKRAPSRIGGSVGGFIVVVVCLCVIILASCIAIFILLRDREPSANEREARRAARDRSRRSTVESAPAPAPAPSPAPTPWGSLSRMFRNATRGGHGWIQASGDAWEADEADAGRKMGMARQHENAPFRHPRALPLARRAAAPARGPAAPQNPIKAVIVNSSVETVQAAHRHRILVAQTLRALNREAEAMPVASDAVPANGTGHGG